MANQRPTGCANAAASEVVVQGQIVATAVSAGTGIADFQLPVSFDGSMYAFTFSDPFTPPAN